MKKAATLFALVLLAGAGWISLRPAGVDDTHQSSSVSLAAPTAAAVTVPATASPAMPLDRGSLQTAAPAPRGDLPPPFDYVSVAPLRDGSFDVQWNFAATARLHPGDTVRVQLPFAAAPYTAVVQDETVGDGGRRISGRLQDDHGVDSWPFSITLSADGRYATANFESGAAHFSIEADPRQGRMKQISADQARLENDAVQ